MMSSQYTMSTYDLPQSPLNLLADNKHRRNPPLTALQGYTQALKKDTIRNKICPKRPNFFFEIPRGPNSNGTERDQVKREKGRNNQRCLDR